MKILAVGSVAFDDVKTPFGERKRALGGSATYFSVSAGFFAPVSLVGVVGDDFDEKYRQMLLSRDIDIDGLSTVKGKTFHWKGEYHSDLNEAHTLDTQLNVFESFEPEISEKYKDSEIVFLANIDPELQLAVLDQVNSPALVACDTMNFWIESKVDSLKEVLKRVDILLINDGETRQLTGESNIIRAARKILEWGPSRVIVKRGEYGVLGFSKESFFGLSAYPVENVFDPTGAGDTFAGGFIGYLAKTGSFTEKDIRKALVYGTVMASFNVEDFSMEQLLKISQEQIRMRYDEMKEQSSF